MTMVKPKYNIKNYNLRPNRKISIWTLAKQIGVGGNGEVWICRNNQKQEYAIKFLKWGGGDAYKRFFDEVTFMEQFRSMRGVMPIIDKYIPEYSKRNDNPQLPFYYVMPLAKSAEKHILQANVDEKVTIIQELLTMLIETSNLPIFSFIMAVMSYLTSDLFSSIKRLQRLQLEQKSEQSGQYLPKWNVTPFMLTNSRQMSILWQRQSG